MKDVDLELTFEPPWDMEMLSDEAKLELGMISQMLKCSMFKC